MSDHDEGIASAIGGELVPKVTSKSGATIGSPIECSSLEDLQTQLRRMLETTSLALIPPLVTTDLYLNSNATFNVSSTVEGSVSNPHRGSKVEGTQAASLNEGAVPNSKINNVNELSMTEVLKETDNPKARIKWQTVVARQIVAAIRDVDGFGYGVQSDFDSKKNGHRFTFGCHDSIWNKERRRRARGLGKVQEGLGSKLFMRPTFNCGGQIIVRFQRTLSRIDVSYAHMAIHRSIASRRAQARSKAVQGSAESFHTFQMHSVGGRGALGATKESRTDPQANGPLVPLNEAARQVTAESHGLSENDKDNAGTREDQFLSRYPSSPLSDAGRPDETKRHQDSSSNLLIPSDHNRRALKFDNTAQDQLTPPTSMPGEALERRGEARHYELDPHRQTDLDSRVNDATHISTEDMQQSLPDTNGSEYGQLIDPQLMPTSELQHMEHSDWLRNPKLTSNSTTPGKKERRSIVRRAHGLQYQPKGARGKAKLLS